MVPLVKHELGQKERHSQLMVKNGTSGANHMKAAGIKCHQLCRADLRCYHKPTACGKGSRHYAVAKVTAAHRAGITNRTFGDQCS